VTELWIVEESLTDLLLRQWRLKFLRTNSKLKELQIKKWAEIEELKLKKIDKSHHLIQLEGLLECQILKVNHFSMRNCQI
jgi:hypothetical protein